MPNVIVDGIEYAPIQPAAGEELRITIVDNKGLTFVGYVDLTDPNELITIRKARCIIRWGTAEHVAELVHGPLENTKLGFANDVIISKRSIVASYVVTGDWYALSESPPF